MKEAAGDLEFEEAARLRDEIKRLQTVELAVGDDPLARQEAIAAAGGGYAGERRRPRRQSPASRAHKPTDADMGPHNWGGGEARPLSRPAPRSMAGKAGTKAVKGKRSS